MNRSRPANGMPLCGTYGTRFAVGGGLSAHAVEERFKNFWVMFGDVGEHLAVQYHPCAFERMHEGSVVPAGLPQRRVQFHEPQSAKRTLAHSPVAVAVRSSFQNRNFRKFRSAFSSPFVPLGFPKESFALCLMDAPAFNSRHNRSWSMEHVTRSIHSRNALRALCSMLHVLGFM